MTIDPNWLAAPIALPLLGAALGLVIARWNDTRFFQKQGWIALAVVSLNLVIALLLANVTIGGEQRLALQMGAWDAPFGITLFADGLTTIMLTLTAILAATTVLYAMGTLDQRGRMNFFPLLLFFKNNLSYLPIHQYPFGIYRTDCPFFCLSNDVLNLLYEINS